MENRNLFPQWKIYLPDISNMALKYYETERVPQIAVVWVSRSLVSLLWPERLQNIGQNIKDRGPWKSRVQLDLYNQAHD